MAHFELSPGVLIDTDRSVAYLMSPLGGIVAIDLSRGTELWRSSAGAKPLAMSGEVLLAQAEAPGPSNALKIVGLNTGRRGEPVTESVVPLPSGVQPMIGQVRGRSFTVEARAVGGEASLSWEFVERPLRGIAAGPVEVLPGEAPDGIAAVAPASAVRGAPGAAAPSAEPGSESQVVRGSARLDLSSGAVSPLPQPPAAAERRTLAAPAAAPDLAPDAVLPDVPWPQFLSADTRHVLSSQRVADDPEWEKYLWTIYERESRRRIGEFRTHLRYAPFFITGSLVIYQSLPYARRSGEKIVEEPLKIRAMDLGTGNALWSQPVRDITDRGPLPP